MKKTILNVNKEKNIQFVFENNTFIIETLQGNMLYNFIDESEAVKEFENWK